LGKVLQAAQAGTLESNDVMIFVAPGSGGLSVDLESIVSQQYGASIKRTVLEVIDSYGINDINVKVIDKGALDYAIRARLVTALNRAGWEPERG
jgi:citrate lyase subunit gamma (acyl carrier protein)